MRTWRLLTSSTKRLRLGIDLDGVTYQWSKTAAWLLNWRFGLDLGESTHWDYLLDHVSPPQWQWLWSPDEDGGIGRGLFRHGHVYKGSFEALRELDQLGDIIIITHRPHSAIDDTMSWLAFNRVPVSTVHVMTDGAPKSSIKPECDLYVDDRASNCIDLAKNTNGTVALWDRPWNRDEQQTLPTDIHIIGSWTQFLELAKEAV